MGKIAFITQLSGKHQAGSVSASASISCSLVPNRLLPLFLAPQSLADTLLLLFRLLREDV